MDDASKLTTLLWCAGSTHTPCSPPGAFQQLPLLPPEGAGADVEQVAASDGYLAVLCSDGQLFIMACCTASRGKLPQWAALPAPPANGAVSRVHLFDVETADGTGTIVTVLTGGAVYSLGYRVEKHFGARWRRVSPTDDLVESLTRVVDVDLAADRTAAMYALAGPESLVQIRLHAADGTKHENAYRLPPAAGAAVLKVRCVRSRVLLALLDDGRMMALNAHGAPSPRCHPCVASATPVLDFDVDASGACLALDARGGVWSWNEDLSDAAAPPPPAERRLVLPGFRAANPPARRRRAPPGEASDGDLPRRRAMVACAADCAVALAPDGRAWRWRPGGGAEPLRGLVGRVRRVFAAEGSVFAVTGAPEEQRAQLAFGEALMGAHVLRRAGSDAVVGAVSRFERERGLVWVSFADGVAVDYTREDLRRLAEDPTFDPRRSRLPIGAPVRKDFEQHGIFTGAIRGYDEEYELYKVVYEDGDEEEATQEEAFAWHRDYVAHEALQAHRVGKRRRAAAGR